MRSGPPVCCHVSAVPFSPAAPCYAHKGRIYATRCRTQGLDSAVVCRVVFPYSRPCVRHRGGKGAKEGRGAEPRGKERLGFQGTAPAPRPHTFGYTRGLPGGQPATRLSLGGRRSAAAHLPPPAPLGPGGEGTPTGGGAPASASTPTWGAKAATGPPRASGSSGFLKHIRHEAQRLGGERVPCGKGAHDTSVSLLPPPAWSLAAPWTPTRWPATAAPATAWSLGLTGSAPGWAVGAHMCGRKRMARRTSARGASFMAAIAAL